MCGITGYLSFTPNPVQRPTLQRMTDQLAHRGPDGEGFWINEKQSLGFGHRRLSIIDLSERGRQPMHYGNGRYTITFNGEIYNYLELKAELEQKGLRFFLRFRHGGLAGAVCRPRPGMPSGHRRYVRFRAVGCPGGTVVLRPRPLRGKTLFLRPQQQPFCFWVGDESPLRQRVGPAGSAQG
ncbi:MAG: hypothetical protein IPN74_01400 [Haliscomenobacter sp.]|nr:hypothetical protein [Haliscomenobacter sp.]